MGMLSGVWGSVVVVVRDIHGINCNQCLLI